MAPSHIELLALIEELWILDTKNKPFLKEVNFRGIQGGGTFKISNYRSSHVQLLFWNVEVSIFFKMAKTPQMMAKSKTRFSNCVSPV